MFEGSLHSQMLHALFDRSSFIASRPFQNKTLIGKTIINQKLNEVKKPGVSHTYVQHV